MHLCTRACTHACALEGLHVHVHRRLQHTYTHTAHVLACTHAAELPRKRHARARKPSRYRDSQDDTDGAPGAPCALLHCVLLAQYAPPVLRCTLTCLVHTHGMAPHAFHCGLCYASCGKRTTPRVCLMLCCAARAPLTCPRESAARPAAPHTHRHCS